MRLLDDDGRVGGMELGGALSEGSSSEWYTPPALFERLGMAFDLDPCAPALPAAPWLPAERRISLPDDGLAAAWEGRVWLNPPYGPHSATWVHRLARHGDGIALVFSRTCTAWAQTAMAAADAVCFIAGRVSFIPGHRQDGEGHNAAAASMLLAYGDECSAGLAAADMGVTFRAEGRLAGAAAAATLWEAS